MYCGRKMICSQIAIHFKHNLLFVISTATVGCLPAAYSFSLISPSYDASARSLLTNWHSHLCSQPGFATQRRLS